MGRIQSNVGLITGIPISDTIDQLIGVSGQSRDLLTSRTQDLQQEQAAVNTLSSRVLSLRFDLDRLKVADPFQARSVSSSAPEVLTATLTGDSTPPLGNFSLRPARVASSQQFVSQRFETIDDIKEAGVFSFGKGGFVDKGISLDELNSGEGIARGEIKITDLAGNSAVVDLSLAQSVDDVLNTINNESEINVTAAVDGDSFTLTDNIGGSGTLAVQEVNGGTTASDLGLAGVTTTAKSEIGTGVDVYRLHGDTKLSKLNDGNGIRLREGTDDLFFTVADKTSDLSIDLSGANTLGDVVEKINSDESLTGKVLAQISADGNRLELTDLTAGSPANGSFTITSGTTGSAAEDLGLTTTADGGVITGARLVSGLSDTLVSSLRGGQGLGTLGIIDITDRNGGAAEVDLTGAETLDRIVELINESAADVVATINEAGSGIAITDTSGGSGNLIIADNVTDELETATALGLVVDAEQSSVDSGSLGRQSLSEATSLASLNGGQGVKASDIRITDSNGVEVAINLNATDNEAQTLGDVIDAINAEFDAGNSAVKARINNSGDGILLTDTGDGDETLIVEDINGELAADLNLTQASKVVEVDGVDTQVIDGASSFSFDLADLETSSSSSVTLASLNDGNGIELSDIRLTDAAGEELVLDLNGEFSDISTVGELIETINSEAERFGVGIEASINEAGTGIEIKNTAEGNGKLIIEDINGSAASKLKILSNDSTTTSVNGSGLFVSQTASQGALSSLASKINDSNSGVTASVLNDGTGFRLQLAVSETGAANEILVDPGNSGFSFIETSKARDALLVVGAGSVTGSGILVSSSTNDFEQVVEGVDLTAVSASDTAVDVNVVENSQEVVDLVQSFVDSYNSLRTDLGDLTAFDAETLSTGLLFGTSEALRVDTDLSRLVTDRFSGLGEFQSLQDIGISVNDSGKLELDTTKLKDAYAEDSASLQNLFAAEDRGVVAKFNSAIERLTDSESGLLTNRNDALQATIDANEARIGKFNESLERQRERLELQFYNLELLISNLQTSREAVDSLQAVPPLSISG